MKRYYISRVLGSGTVIDSYYSELRVYIQQNWPDEPHFEKQIIAHVIPWCIMKYDLSQAAHDDIMANLTGIFSFPSTGLNRTVAEIPVAKRSALRDKLEAIGFEFDWATAETTVREILKYLCRSIQVSEWANVSISTLSRFHLYTTVADIPTEKRNKIAQNLINLGVPIDWIIGTTTIGEIVQKIQRNDDGSKRLFGTIRRKQWLFQDEGEF